MEITIRNITKDNMRDFSNDHTINLPMDEEKLRSMLGNDEWIIVDSPVGDELTNITELNDLLSEKSEETLRILQSAGYLFDEIKNGEFTIVDFDSETSQWNYGYGIYADEWWKGYLLHHLGYMEFPFEYTEEMEDWVKFEELWAQADSEGWRATRYNNTTYLVNRY